MKKKYLSSSDVSVSVIMPSGKSTHIKFSPLTGGGSVFYTDNEDVQKGLQCHYAFGKLFREVEIEPEPEVVKKATEADVAQPEINVTSLEDAKDYLCDKFGMSRTKLRTAKQILQAAASVGVKFSGIGE